MSRYIHTELGRQTTYSDHYDPSLLCPISRKSARGTADSVDATSFRGADLWTAYEISWLNPDGLPQVAIGEFVFPCTSEFIIESKSFKLYLNSYAQTQFRSAERVQESMHRDLSAVAGIQVDVILYQISEYNAFKAISEPQGVLIDHHPVSIDCYQPNSGLLQADSSVIVEETLYSHLLKSNCPVTNQPDWASVYISYKGPKIDCQSLLKYIVSFRQHQDFHEQCIEKIFSDILACCGAQQLTVYARYLRRGGLDINPFRSTCHDTVPSYRQVRQ
jgi:7-cyano-7-deazaguanine reductase